MLNKKWGMAKQSGQSILEVVVAVTVSILIVAALVFATLFSLRDANFAKNSAQATKLAQEGIEMVRSGRDRNSSISISGVSTVNSWSNTGGSVWTYQIRVAGGCDNPSTNGKCYFRIGSNGSLTNTAAGFAATSFPSSLAESVSSASQVFQRIATLSDDASYQVQKTVTVIVRWEDATGAHESRLVTILRKL